jgi:simple sugar transport system ATP-binding protein
MAREARETLERLGVEIDPEVTAGSLTLAQQQIVEIARALRENPRLLILDEPTSALASGEVSLVLAAVRRVAETGVAVIYVSHRMDEIRQIADTATVMRNGRVIDTVDLGGANTGAIVRLMIGDDLAAAPEREARDLGPVVLEVDGLAVPPKLDAVSFQVRAGEILGIAGLLGSGRSELLRAIAGWERVSAGVIRIHGTEIDAPRPRRMRRAGVGLTPENRKREGVLLDLGIDENIVLSDFGRVSRLGVLSAPAIRDTTRFLGERLHIKAHDLAQPISTLSGGNQQKAVIARWLHADTDVLLLDEPTRGVDVEAKSQIYAIMRQVADEGKAVVFVSSEIEELPLACDRVLVLRDGGIREELRAPDIDLTRLLEAAMASHS